MTFKWAVLIVLAKRPGRHVTFAEIKQEAGQVLEAGNRAGQARYPELGDLDLLQAGLVSIDKAGLQITEAGLSLAPPGAASAADPFEPGDGSTEARLMAFELELQRLTLPMSEAEEATARYSVVDEPATERSEAPADAIEPVVHSPQPAPRFPQPPFAANRKPPPQSTGLLATAAKRARDLTRLGRGHVVHDDPKLKTERVAGSGAAVLALLSLVAVIGCAAAAFALVQIKSLKTDIAALQRELAR